MGTDQNYVIGAATVINICDDGIMLVTAVDQTPQLDRTTYVMMRILSRHNHFSGARITSLFPATYGHD